MRKWFVLLSLALPLEAQVVCTSAVQSECGNNSFSGATTSLVGTTSVCSVGAPDTANSVCLGSNTVTGEGATANANETVLAFGDATADGTLTATSISTSGIVGYKLATSGAADVAIELAPTGTSGAGVVLPSGTAGNTALRFGTYTAGAGLFYNSGLYVSDATNGAVGMQSGGYVVTKAAGGFAISSGTNAATGYDTYLTRSAAGQFLVSTNGTSGGSLKVGAGTGTGNVTVGGVLCKGAPAQATTGTSEEALATCAIPANTLTAAGSILKISWNGQTAANGNNKTVYVRIGGSGTCPGTCTLIYQSATSALNNADVYSLSTDATYKSSTKAVVKGVAQTVSDAAAATASTYGSYMNRDASVAWTSALEVTISALTPTAGDFTLLSYSVEVAQ